MFDLWNKIEEKGAVAIPIRSEAMTRLEWAENSADGNHDGCGTSDGTGMYRHRERKTDRKYPQHVGTDAGTGGKSAGTCADR